MSKKRSRANGEGSFFKLPDGRWAGVITIEDDNGNPKRIKREGPTREAVRIKLAKLATNPSQATTVHTVATLLIEWEPIHARKNRATTAQTLHQMCKAITKQIGTVQLRKLNSSRIQDFIDTLAAQYSPSYVHLCVTWLRTALSWAVRKKMIAFNPARDEDITLPKIEQTQALTLASQSHRLGVLVYLGLRGLRRGEIAGLRLEDFDLDADPPRLTIHGAMHHLRGQAPSYGDTKTPSSRRVVPLDATSVAAVRWFLSCRAAEEKVMDWKPSPYLFRALSDGRPAGPHTIYHAFKLIAKRADLPDTTRLHDLRHSVVTFLVAQRVDPKRIAALLGHESITTTMDLYADIAIESLRAESDMLAHLVTPIQASAPERDQK